MTVPTLPPPDSRAPMRSWYLPGGTWRRADDAERALPDDLVASAA